MRAQGRSFWLGAGIVAFSILNPANLHAIGDGHPEEILGAALCVAALISASEDRSLLVTGTLLGLAVGTKQWALLAIGPVLLAAPRGRIRIGLLGSGHRGAAHGAARARQSRRVPGQGQGRG